MPTFAETSVPVDTKKTLIHDHLDHCLDDAVGPLDPEHRVAIDEFRTIAKYL